MGELIAQREIHASIEVSEQRIYLDRGLTGTNRTRSGLDKVLAAVRVGDTLVQRGVRLSLGRSIYDPAYRVLDRVVIAARGPAVGTAGGR